MLFSPAAHEELTETPWDAERARAVVNTLYLGTAIYLADCLDGAGKLPLP